MSKKTDQKDNDKKIDDIHIDYNNESKIDENEDENELNINSESVIKKLKKELKQCKIEKQEFLDGWQRSKADYINLKRRSEEEKGKIRDYGIEEFVFKLIPIIDNFEMAFKDENTWNKAPENWREGIQFIYNQMINVFNDYQITQINPLGKKFDPEFHHSVEIIKVDNQKKDGIIIEVQQKGYQLKDKVIRPASVKVGEYKN